MHTPTNRSFTFCAIVAILILFGVRSSLEAQSSNSYGDYAYEHGDYRRISDVIINETIDSASCISNSVIVAQQFLNNNATFGGWRSSNNSIATASGGFGFQLSAFQQQLRGVADPAYGPKEQWLGFRLGPLFVSDVYTGAGFMYSEYQGSPLHMSIGGHFPNTSGVSEDSFASILWAQAQMTMYISDRFAFVFTPSIYYLPLENKVGWSVLNPTFIGLSNALVSPNAMLQSVLRVPLGESLQLVMADSFHVFSPQIHLMRNSPYYWASLYDWSPLDTAGRYQFGGYGPFAIDTTSDGRFAGADRFIDEDQMSVMNMLNLSMMGHHGNNIDSQVYYQRQDWWDSDFSNRTGWHTGGLQVIQNGYSFTPYARYEFNAVDDFSTNYQYAILGFSKSFAQNLSGYVEGGWLWSTVNGQGSTDSWLASAGLRQRLGPYTRHGVDFGRAPISNFRSRYLATYAQYYLMQTIGANAEATLFVQKADLETLGGQNASTDRSTLTVGALLTMMLSPKSQMVFTASYENGDMNEYAYSWETLTYRLAYARKIAASVDATCFYQYQTSAWDSAVYDDFSEHLLYMGITKRF